MMAHSAAQHPDELVFSLLSKGYDGQNFFDTEHVYVNDLGVEVGVSNMQAGAELPWFLLAVQVLAQNGVRTLSRKLGLIQRLKHGY